MNVSTKYLSLVSLLYYSSSQKTIKSIKLLGVTDLFEGYLINLLFMNVDVITTYSNSRIQD